MHGKVLKFLNITAGIALFLSGCVKTTTHLETQRCQNSAFDKKCLYAGVELEHKSMTLDDMVEVALRRNLYLLVKKWECAIQQEAATGAKLDMLPELLASADDTQRSNKPASTSEYMDGSPPFPPSFSSEERTKNWDVTLTWNMLDFGISYFRSRQETNRILMQKLEYERMKQNLILDIVQNYWNAVVNKEAMNKTEQFLVEIETHQMVLERAANTALVSRTRVLEIKDQVLQKTLKIQEHEREYLFAKSELSRLMGLPPSVEFDITYDRSRPLTVDLPDIKQLEETSLFYRPELYSYDIEEKIAVDEVRLAILGYIPGVSLFSSLLYSDNKFLVYNYWNNIGAQVIWDLFSIPAGRSYQRKAKKEIALARKNRLALSIGAITQVHMAHLIYHNELDHYLLIQELQDVKNKLLLAAEKKRMVGRFDLADLLEYKTGVLEAEIRLWKAYGDIQFSLEKLNNAMGRPLCYRNTPTTTLYAEHNSLKGRDKS